MTKLDALNASVTQRFGVGLIFPESIQKEVQISARRAVYAVTVVPKFLLLFLSNLLYYSDC